VGWRGEPKRTRPARHLETCGVQIPLRGRSCGASPGDRDFVGHAQGTQIHRGGAGVERVKIGGGNGYGSGDGDGFGSGDGFGCGYGYGFGKGDGRGSG